MQGLSERHYAAHVGLSRGAIQKAKEAGRLVQYADGSIDAVASDARRAAMTDPAKQRSLSLAESPKTLIEGLLSSMAGRCAVQGGTWRMHAGAYRLPEVTLTADDVRAAGWCAPPASASRPTSTACAASLSALRMTGSPMTYFRLGATGRHRAQRQRWHNLRQPISHPQCPLSRGPALPDRNLTHAGVLAHCRPHHSCPDRCHRPCGDRRAWPCPLGDGGQTA